MQNLLRTVTCRAICLTKQTIGLSFLQQKELVSVYGQQRKGPSSHGEDPSVQTMLSAPAHIPNSTPIGADG